MHVCALGQRTDARENGKEKRRRRGGEREGGGRRVHPHIPDVRPTRAFGSTTCCVLPRVRFFLLSPPAPTSATSRIFLGSAQTSANSHTIPPPSHPDPRMSWHLCRRRSNLPSRPVRGLAARISVQTPRVKQQQQQQRHSKQKKIQQQKNKSEAVNERCMRDSSSCRSCTHTPLTDGNDKMGTQK